MGFRPDGAADGRQCSIVLTQNQDESDSVELVIQKQSSYYSVGEIILLDSLQSSTIKRDTIKLTRIKADIGFGARLRWIAGLLAFNAPLVFQRDDILLPEETIVTLV